MKKDYKIFGALFLVGLLAVALVFAKPGGRPKKHCNDKIDNDGDGYIDRDDPGCASPQDTSELNPNIECDDGSDNDGDNDIDFNDGGCSGPTDNDETDCGDGICEGGELCDACVVDCGHCDSCSDTDGGFAIFIQGTVDGYLNQQYYDDTDFCLDNTTLVEFYCSDDYAYNSTYDCSINATTCSNGACV